MKDVKCPNCEAALSVALLDSGWCESCGHKVPRFIYKEAGARAPGEKQLSSIVRNQGLIAPAEEMEALPFWKLAVLGVVLLGIAVVIIRQFV
jgi:hypothetical protein